jgi:signal transduction histidine kinase
MNDQDLVIAIVTVTILFFLFAVFTVIYFLLFRRNQKKHLLQMEASQKAYEAQLLQAQIEIQESTYRHIAKELHDNVGQLLSTTKMLIGITELKLDQVPDTMLTANATLSKAIQELRMLSRSLDKEWLERFNFLENLHSEVERINSSETIKASINCSTSIDMSPEAQLILFRIVQEALQNAIRHAQPSRLHIVIEESQQLIVRVLNDGRPLPQNFQGMGTTNMKQRAQLFGGTVHWLSVDEETVVTICLPLNQVNENQSRISR